MPGNARFQAVRAERAARSKGEDHGLLVIIQVQLAAGPFGAVPASSMRNQSAGVCHRHGVWGVRVVEDAKDLDGRFMHRLAVAMADARAHRQSLAVGGRVCDEHERVLHAGAEAAADPAELVQRGHVEVDVAVGRRVHGEDVVAIVEVEVSRLGMLVDAVV